LLAQIGYDHAQSVTLESRKPVKGQMDRKQTAISVTQVEFALDNRLLSRRKKSFKSVSLGLRKERLNRKADHFLVGPAHQFRKPAVAVKQITIPGKGRRAFAHGLHEHAIGGFAALQRNDLLSPTAGNHQSIHFAGLYGAQSFLRSV
jgi:hypothetical protein